MIPSEDFTDVTLASEDTDDYDDHERNEIRGDDCIWYLRRCICYLQSRILCTIGGIAFNCAFLI